MGSSKSATVGYRYYMGLHFGICHGPVDGLHQITVGERSAWSGSQTASGAVGINAPELFGGDSREGGVYGVLDVMMGESTQPANSYLAGLLGAGIPGFRGIMSAVFQGGLVASNNPYVKPWAFRVKRILQGWTGGTAWYPEKAEVNAAATVCGDGYSEYFSGEYSFDPNLAATTPEASGSTVVISGMAATDILQVTLSPIENNAWSRWLGYGGGAGYYPGAIDYPLWWSQISIKSAEGVITRLFDTSGMTAEAAYSANSATVGNVTGSTSYQLWIEDDVLYNRGSLSLVVKKLSANGFINADMNPAHIIYQCITDSAWGMGYPTSAIDSASFTAAADALYAEGFGLSMLWNRQETIEAFIQVVLDHIGGMLYVKPDTGAFAIKLIRDDYDRGTLPQYGPNNLISAEDYQRQAWGETINEITVVYTAPCTGKEAAATVQDTANIMAQGGVVAQTRSYTGITNPTLAQRVAMRDLAAASTPLARIRLTATRVAWEVFPGDVFRLTWPEYDIADVVYRSLSVNRGTLQDGQIIIDAVEDVYALPENTYLVDQEGLWEDPNNEPIAASYRSLIEAPYWDLARSLSAADMDYVDSLSGYLETLAVRPTSDAINYTIFTRVGSADYIERGNGDFCPSATIVETLTKTTTAITLANGIDLDLVVAGKYAVIENEYVLVSAIDYVTGTATISRGVLDTVPEAHTAGSRIWFSDGYQGFETTEYADSETVDVKLLPVTGRGELNILLAPADSLTFDQRQYRPYVPGNIKFAGSVSPSATDYPSNVYGTLTVSWAHRDRLTQTAYIVEQDESDIGPEAGVTYTVEIREGGTLVESSSGISGTSYTATISGDHNLEITLYSMRGGLSSWQSHIHSLAMYGDSYMLTEDGDTRADEAGTQMEQE
jgi:hypothetical protein